jgi:hypothetical protein
VTRREANDRESSSLIFAKGGTIRVAAKDALDMISPFVLAGPFPGARSNNRLARTRRRRVRVARLYANENCPFAVLEAS